MAGFLQSVILSDITLFLVMGLLLVLITSWAYSLREYAGYLLGWLIGFLLVLLISVFFAGQEPGVMSEADAIVFIGPAVFLGLMIASVLGLGVGFAVLALVHNDGQARSKVTRSLTIAIATSFTLASGYTMILASYSLRLLVAAFALAVAIGALLNFILVQQRVRRALVVTNIEPEGEEVLAQSAEPRLSADDLPSPLAQRIHNLRTRASRYGQ
ncbi:MAG: hypothetical protein K8J31_29055 [Anaerolineae bacterium]|nr:hypothetical protein [Anaerolineae bacterium]